MENEKTVTEQLSSGKEETITNTILFEKLQTLEKLLIQIEDKLMKPLIS
jgi:hypothetical protein